MLIKRILTKTNANFRILSLRRLSNRNVLSLHQRGMYQEMFPEAYKYSIEYYVLGARVI